MRWLFGLSLGVAMAALAMAQDIPLNQFLLPGENWQEIAVTIKSATGLAADAKGNIYILDQENGKILRLGEGNKAEAWADCKVAKNGLKAGPGGQILAIKQGPARKTGGKQGKAEAWNLTTFDGAGKAKILKPNVQGELLAVGPRTGRIYFVEIKDDASLAFLQPGAEDALTLKRLPFDGFNELEPPEVRMAISPDEGTASFYFDNDAWLYSMRIEADGSLTSAQKYWSLRTEPGNPMRVEELIFDRANRLFAATSLGIQVFDPTGRLSGVIANPPDLDKAGPKNSTDDDDETPRTYLAFGGSDFDRLYLVNGKKLFVRKMKAQGVLPPK